MAKDKPGFIKSTPTPTRNIINNLADFIGGSGKKKGKTKDGDKVDKSSPKFYQSLINYYFRRRSEVDKGWKFCEEEYNHGRTVDSKEYNIEEVRPARAYAIVSNVESLVMGQSPRIFARGFTSEREELVGKVLEQVVNNEWQQDSRLKKEKKLVVRDCSKVGFGVMLTSYEEDVEVDAKAQEKEADERKAATTQDPIIAEADAQASLDQAKIEAETETPKLATNYEQDDRVVRRKVVSRRISPWSFIADPTATSEDDWKWVGRVFICDLDAVKNDPLLKNTSGLKPSAMTMDSTKEGHLKKIIESYTKDTGFPYDIVVMYEIFIRNPDGTWSLRVMADGHDKFLRQVENPYWIGCPYRLLRWNEDGENLFPQSDIQVIASEMVTERLLYTKSLDGYSREQSDTTLVDKSLGITTENFTAIEDPDIGKIIEIARDAATANVPLQNLIYKLPKDQKSPEMLNFLASIERSIQISSGLSPNQFGQPMKSGTTATEAAEVGGMARGRAKAKFDALEEFIAGVAQDRIGIMCQSYSPTDIYRLAGKEAAAAWAQMTWTKGDVQNGIFFIVEPGSTKKPSEQGRAQTLMNIIGMINQDPGVRSNFDILKMIMDLIRNLGEFHPEKYLHNKDGQSFSEQLAELDAERLAPGTGGEVGQAGGSPEQVFSGNEAQALGAAQ